MPGSSKKIDVDALHEADARHALEVLGLGDSLRSDELNCAICDVVLNADRLGAIRRLDSGEFALACNRLDCIRMLGSGGP